MAEDRRAEVPQPPPLKSAHPQPAEAAPHPALQMPRGAPAAASSALAAAAAAAIRQDKEEMVLLETRLRGAASGQHPGDGSAVQCSSRVVGGGSVSVAVEGVLIVPEGDDSAVEEADGAADGAAEAAAAAASFVRIPEDERLQLEGDFLELMQVRR